MPYRIFLVACENSSDLHGAHLVRELQDLAPNCRLRGVGGPRMEAAGLTIYRDMTRMSALGWGDVIRQYFTYRRIFFDVLEEIESWQPNAVVLIDSPAFNLRLAKKIKKRFPVVYYISPQIWAWGGRRIHTIKRTVSKMLVILPFEKAIYEEAGIPCEFIGHPLIGQVRTSASRSHLRQRWNFEENEIWIGLLAGSRPKEVARILPVMLETASQIKKKKPEVRFCLTRAPNISETLYEDILKAYPHLNLRRFGHFEYDLVAALDFALVTSGTATLETTLLGVPYFLLYKTGWSTYFLGRHLIRVPFLGIVNILAGKPVVPEFIQNEAHPARIAEEVLTFLENRTRREAMLTEFARVRQMLGKEGASRKAAQAVLDVLKNSQES